ncbi:MAG TPA: hypothetical protein VGI10_28955 [Polyangiaceae bacterium]|jgi:hypothetical protein
MKLSDIVSGMHLSIFAEVPLLIFLGVFIGVAMHIMQTGEQAKQASLIPLSDDTRRKGEPQ